MAGSRCTCFGVRVSRTLDYPAINLNPRRNARYDHNARPSQTDRQTDSRGQTRALMTEDIVDCMSLVISARVCPRLSVRLGWVCIVIIPCILTRIYWTLEYMHNMHVMNKEYMMMVMFTDSRYRVGHEPLPVHVLQFVRRRTDASSNPGYLHAGARRYRSRTTGR